MLPTRQGSIRLFRFAGISVYLHWSWFLIFLYRVGQRTGEFSSPVWAVLECLALFLIVLMHEFGHALACRSVGGQADQIVLWPFGGVAYVAPPQRPGPVLWSIAAGPLVNVALAPILTLILWLTRNAGWPAHLPDAYAFVRDVCIINYVLLIFNMLPIYPLDGGQILQSLLWFWLGRAKSQVTAAIIGFIGLAGLVGLALELGGDGLYWTLAICAFILMNCWRGLQRGLALLRLANAPRQHGFVCPGCRAVPPQGPFWVCGQCRQPFDIFANRCVCPHCGVEFGAIRCLECGEVHSVTDWTIHIPAPPKIV